MSRVRSLLSRIDTGADGRPGAREIRALVLIVGVGVLIRLLYAAWLHNDPLVGDLRDYDAVARLFSEGNLFWSDTPYGIPHASAWKPPGYWLWIGMIYTVAGPSPTAVAVAQALVCGPAVILLTWLLARRLLNHQIAMAAAAIVAIYPFAFQYEELMFPEALVVPLTMLFLVLVLTKPPTVRLALGCGALFGILMLLRPSSFYLVPGALAAWWAMEGPRAAFQTTAIAVACAVLVVLPWTVRNAVVLDGFLPISVQDGALAGTFNDDAANDPAFPYAWRPLAERDRDILTLPDPLPEPELRSELVARGRDYIADHPESVPLAVFWNGITRLWDIRRPAHVINESSFETRKKPLTQIGLAMYYVLLPLALLGMWKLRRSRQEFVLAVAAMVVAAIFVFSIVSGTRYRAPFEPLIVILACAALVPALWQRARVPDAG